MAPMAPMRLIGYVIRRPTRLIPERMMPETLRDLALSLQIYKQGRLRLSQTVIPTACTSMH